MFDNFIQLIEDLIKHDLKDLVRSSVEETLNALLDSEWKQTSAKLCIEMLTENKQGLRG